METETKEDFVMSELQKDGGRKHIEQWMGGTKKGTVRQS